MTMTDEQIKEVVAAHRSNRGSCNGLQYSDHEDIWRDSTGDLGLVMYGISKGESYRIKPDPEPTCWGYPLSRLMGAWVVQKIDTKLKLPILGIDDSDTPVKISSVWRSKAHCEQLYTLIESTVRPEA